MTVEPKPKSPFDAWLDAQIRVMYAAVAEEPVPPSLLRYIEEAETHLNALEPSGRRRDDDDAS